jgi:hypothetical protein
MRLTGVPHPCQKQPTMKGSRGHSRDIRTTADLPPRSWRSWEIQPDKEPVARLAVGDERAPARNGLD